MKKLFVLSLIICMIVFAGIGTVQAHENVAGLSGSS